MESISDTLNPSTSPSLIARAGRNDPAAWKRLCVIYGPLVYRWARAAGLQECDSADVGQEVFRTLHARIGEFDLTVPGATFRGWLRTITRHKIGDLYRRTNQQPGGVGGTTAWQRQAELPDSLDDTWESQQGIDDEQIVLRGTLEMLKTEFEPTTWQAFWRSTIDEVSTQEIAAELQMTPAAVRQAKYRVLRRLRDELGTEFNSPSVV